MAKYKYPGGGDFLNDGKDPFFEITRPKSYKKPDNYETNMYNKFLKYEEDEVAHSEQNEMYKKLW